MSKFVQSLYDLSMSLPSIAQLCRSLPQDLVPAAEVEPGATEITAVHVSELVDPTPFLEGGELLLTTGLSLPDNDLGLRRYVGRLRGAGVAALGLGLGPHLDEPPSALVRECAAAGLTLLVVPPASAFLTVTKEYWAARSRSSHQELTDALTSHGRLVSAMLGADPVLEVLRVVSSAAGAWTTLTDQHGVVQQVYPSGRAHDAIEAGRRLALEPLDARSTRTFPLRDEVVMVLPVAHEDRVTGHVMLGSSEPVGGSGRRVATTAAALLSLDAAQSRRAQQVRRARGESVAELLDMALVDPARRLAARVGVAAPPDTVSVLVVESKVAPRVLDALSDLTPAGLPSVSRSGASGRGWAVLPMATPPAQEVGEVLRSADPHVRAVLSGPVSVELVHDTRVGLVRRLPACEPGALVQTDASLLRDPVGAAKLEAVLSYRRAELVPTLVAYLRHRGRWDETARSLGLHRNTVRHRIGRVRELLGADIDDPDVASRVWLHLRESGRA